MLPSEPKISVFVSKCLLLHLCCREVWGAALQVRSSRAATTEPELINSEQELLGG